MEDIGSVTVGLALGLLIGSISSAIYAFALATLLRAREEGSFGDAAKAIAQIIALPTFWFGGPFLATIVLKSVRWEITAKWYTGTLMVAFLALTLQRTLKFIDSLEGTQSQNSLSSGRRKATIAIAGSIILAIAAAWMGILAWRHVSGVVPPIATISITSPSEGDEVERTRRVSGVTSVPSWHHYIVVTSVKTGQSYVQSSNAEISGDSWSAIATFGVIDSQHEKFVIECITTKDAVSPQALLQKSDSVRSRSVTVTRR